MKQMKPIIAFLFFILTMNAYGQVTKINNYFPIWSFHQDSINIHGISLGLWSLNNNVRNRNTNTNGIKFELIGAGILIPLSPRNPIVESDSAFIKLKHEPLSEKINGLSLSTLGTFCHCLTNGLTVGLIGQINFQVNGISTSLFMNYAQKHNGLMLSVMNNAYYISGLQIGLFNDGNKTNGLQIAIAKNNANEVKGVQIGLINNSKNLKGLQISILENYSDEIKGIQIGLFNKSKNLKVLQIGFWNVNQKRSLPFINWNFK